MSSYTYDETNRMVKGVNDAGEQSYYFFNGLGVLVTNEWVVAKNNHGYHDVTPNVESPAAALENANDNNGAGHGNSSGKTSDVIKDFVIDYNSYAEENLMEYELFDEGLTYRYVYGVDKLGVTAYTVPNGSASVTTAEGDLPLYYHMDHMGSSEFLTSDVTQRITSWTSYDEWGNITHNAVLKCGERELDLVKTYTGHERDSVLGMYYAKARMYDTADKHGSTKANKLGDKRFTAVDPVKGDVRNPQTMVQYTYVLNNPIFYVDPLGMMSVDKLNLLADIYVNTNGLTESQLYLTCLVLNGKNAGTAHHEFVSIITAKELKQQGINYEIEHAVQNNGQWMEIDVLASTKDKTAYWIYEVKPKGQQYKVRTEEQIERYNKALICEEGKEKVRYSNFPDIFLPKSKTITLFNNMPNAFSQQAIKMEISHNSVGLITYRMWLENGGDKKTELNTKTAAAKAMEETEFGRAVDTVSGVLGQYTLGELKEKFEQGKTLTGLRNSLAVNSIAQNTTYFVLAGKVYRVGGAIAQGVLEGSIARSWVVNTLGI